MATQTLTPSTPTTQTPPAYDPNAANNLARTLNDSFDNSSTYTGILDRYSQAGQATAANTQATGQYITSVVGGNTNFEKGQTAVQKESALEGRGGFATNVAVLTNLQRQGDQRVKQLTDQANQALMANNAAGAAALSDLAVKEQDALTTARTNFLTNYFATQGEARSEASFQTPEQKSVMDLANQYPGAHISPTDSLSDASAKITSSPLYQANLGKVQQDIATAQAQAAQAQAQAAAAPIEARAALTSAGAAATSAAASAAANYASAAQTRYLTQLYQGGSSGATSAQDVSDLLNNKLTPQSLSDKYASVPNGGLIVSNILSQAQAKGYNLNAGNLTGLGQQEKTKVLNSGNVIGQIGLGLQGLFNAGTSALYGGTASLSSGASTGSVKVVSPSGQIGTIPAANLQAALSAGYKQSQ